MTLAILAAASEIPVKPKMPAMMAMTKNINTHINIAVTPFSQLLLRYRIVNSESIVKASSGHFSDIDYGPYSRGAICLDVQTRIYVKC